MYFKSRTMANVFKTEEWLRSHIMSKNGAIDLRKSIVTLTKTYLAE